jgi:hypothetical protein
MAHPDLYIRSWLPFKPPYAVILIRNCLQNKLGYGTSWFGAHRSFCET